MQYLRGGGVIEHTHTRYMDAQLDARFGDCLLKAGAEHDGFLE